MIKHKLLLAALIAASILIPAAGRADGIQIQIGDRQFHNHGDRYWDNDYEMVWSPGHMGPRHHWIHGQYIRGEHRGHHGDRHEDRHDDRHDNEPHK